MIVAPSSLELGAVREFDSARLRDPLDSLRTSAALHELHPNEAEALAFLKPLSADYPDLERWYLTKVVPGLRSGSRALIRVQRDGQLVGVGIGKIAEERKICTVRVAPSHFGRGIGVRLFESLLRWLEVDRPHLTISEGKLPMFERIFDYYGFAVTSVHKGLYVRHSCEFGYNEVPNTVSALPPVSSAQTVLSSVNLPPLV